MILEFGINEGEQSFISTYPKLLGAFRRHEGQKTSGNDPRNVLEEHRMISAKRYKYLDKYRINWKNKKAMFYRIRRAFWYYKRGKIINLSNRLKKAYINK